MEQPKLLQDENNRGEIDVSGYASLSHTNDNGEHELSVLVSGVNCAGCIQKIESKLKSQPEITHARLNFSTKRLAIAWQGDENKAGAFVTMVEKLGYGVRPYDAKTENDTTRAEERFLLLCLGVAGFAMGNVMLLSVGVWATTQETMGMATREFMHWISALIALPTILFSGRPFFRSAAKALSNGHTNMDVPISLAITLAGGMSLYETLRHGEHVYFDSAVMLIFFLLIGRYLDFRAKKNARGAATDLLSTFTGFAQVFDPKTKDMRPVPIRDLEPDMVVHVATGEKFPVDGVVLDGQSSIDTSLVTGETLPRLVQKDDHVYAGTLNLDAPLKVTVAKAADDSLLADIVRLMEKAGQGQAKYVRLADKAARLYTPLVHSFAALAFLGWWGLGGMVWQDALMIAVTVLIITCPCALGLAVPVVQVLASGQLMKRGILVKSGDALERLAVADTVMLDKTGTLTMGHPVLEGAYQKQDLQMAASLAQHSRHPLSKALVSSYKGIFLSIDNVKEHAGKGLEGVYEGKPIKLGSFAWIDQKQSRLCETQSSRDNQNEKQSLWLRVGKEKPVLFQFTDPLRPDTVDVIAQLKANGLNPVLVSGDRRAVADHIGAVCGIDKVYGEKTPPEKFEILEKLKSEGHKVLMIGDGLNDAPVLAGADVSMAPGTALDMAQNAADIVFMGDRFSPVYQARYIAQKTQMLVKQNFALAVIYNIIAIPLALGGYVTPFIAALAMSGSSLIVIANSFRLKLMKDDVI